MATEQERNGNPSNAKGAWKRTPTKFHGVISRDPGAEFPAESGRYRLYISFTCPWAHRTLMTRSLMGLEDVISLTVCGLSLVSSHASKKAVRNVETLTGSDLTEEEKQMLLSNQGWKIITKDDPDYKEENFEPHGFKALKDLYEHASPGYTDLWVNNGKRPVFSVPVLFDEKTQQIVNNESSEIIRMLVNGFRNFATGPGLVYRDILDPADEETQKKMKEVDDIVYGGINDGVYRCGFSHTQEAYEEAYHAHWKAMDEIERRLGLTPFLTGNKMTLSDVRLFATLARYDVVYYSHFKTSRNMVRDMPNMFAFFKRMYNVPEIKKTVRFTSYVLGYMGKGPGNPNAIYPIGAFDRDYSTWLK